MQSPVVLLPACQDILSAIQIAKCRSICLSVRLSVCHTLDPPLICGVYLYSLVQLERLLKTLQFV